MKSEIRDWLRGLDDASIADWANKGLLKRGSKALAGEDPAQWQAGDECQAHIEGHRQQLSGVGFAALSCDCPAFGPCHHLCAFILGLRSLASVADDDGDASAPAEAPPATPWLSESMATLEKQLGAAHSRRALQWLARAQEALLDEEAHALVGTLDYPDAVTVRIPRAGGLAAATCSCKAPACVHRALVIWQARRQAGVDTPALPELGLDAQGQATLGQLEQWLQALALQGGSGSGPAFLDQGEALATELRQADLPRLGTGLQGLLQLLRDGRARQGGASERQQAAIAAVWVLARGLRQSPMPRPFLELAGVHRRQYRPVRQLALRAIALECWETLSGQRGFSVHFQRADNGAFLSWSESRTREQDPGWQPQAAIAQAQWAGLELPTLLLRGCQLDFGWQSEDGRLSGREGTRARPAEPPIAEPPCEQLAPLLREHAHRLQQDPWAQHPPRLVRLPVARQGPLEEDRALQQWTLEIEDNAPLTLTLHGDLSGVAGEVASQLRRRLQAGARLREVCGRLLLGPAGPRLQPISVRWDDEAHWHHLSVHALRTLLAEKTTP